MEDAGALLAALERQGLLMLQDPVLPSAVAILAGGPVRGSWWSHPAANEMFRVLEEAARHPDVTTCKLIGGKVTLVHRRLWPALLAVATSGEPWQTAGLSAAGQALLARLGDDGVEASGAAVKELELRLLARAEQVHTAAGKHLARLERWPVWAKRARCRADRPAAGKAALGDAVAALGGAPALLPWNGKPRRRR
jgi:hypothetical protein